MPSSMPPRPAHSSRSPYRSSCRHIVEGCRSPEHQQMEQGPLFLLCGSCDVPGRGWGGGCAFFGPSPCPISPDRIAPTTQHCTALHNTQVACCCPCYQYAINKQRYEKNESWLMVRWRVRWTPSVSISGTAAPPLYPVSLPCPSHSHTHTPPHPRAGLSAVRGGRGVWRVLLPERCFPHQASSRQQD